jgi:hypothetical protein
VGSEAVTGFVTAKAMRDPDATGVVVEMTIQILVSVIVMR